MRRREFLKLLALLPVTGSPVWKNLQIIPARTNVEGEKPPNILILVFDAFSAKNASLYGYSRATTPNLARFAERASVYHAHYAGGNFTNPGTASLLTGTYPWSHRCLHLYSGVQEDFVDKSLFQVLKGYHSITYSQNLVAVSLLHQFHEDIDDFKKMRDLCLIDHLVSDRLFFKDYRLAVSRERVFRPGEVVTTWPSSYLYFLLNRAQWLKKKNGLNAQYREEFPRGLPMHHEQLFKLEDSVDWLQENLGRLPEPFLGYFHFSPPHDPYNPRREFVGMFDGDREPPTKPPHFFSKGITSQELVEFRRQYDEYVAYADAEFGRLYRHLESSGILDDTCLIVTSDHGEMFERGIVGHATPTLFEPVIHIPLLVSKPGQRERRDIYTATSAVDLLPTLTDLAGQPAPPWCEGRVLPTSAEVTEADGRTIFVVEAKQNLKMGPLTKATVALLKDGFKLIHYRGYEGYEDEYELFDLNNDPEELENLYRSQKAVAEDLRVELLSALQRVR